MTTRHKRMKMSSEEKDLAACNVCGLPESMGRHRFVVIYNGRPITVCNPLLNESGVALEMARRAEVFKELALLTKDDLLLAYEAIKFWISEDTGAYDHEPKTDQMLALMDKLEKILKRG